MAGKIISLDEFRSKKMKRMSLIDQEFSKLLRNARELRDMRLRHAAGEIATTTWEGLQNWFQKEIADEVFRKQLFDRSVLTSIWHVSELLTAFARNHLEHVTAGNYLEAAKSNNPVEILQAANCAFLVFVFWPEARERRSVRYRRLAQSCGPALYMRYADCAHRAMGYSMAEAFEPLGEIARERFACR